MKYPIEDCRVNTVLFDYGGVLAEEGFREGLQEIARLNGIDEDIFYKTAEDTIQACGYLVGKAPENLYWELLRKKTGIRGDDLSFRNEILSRFTLRMWMIDLIKRIRDFDIRVGILSDQTNWLEEINARDDFFRWFDYIFNSYRMGKGKREPSHFDDVLESVNAEASMVLFIDDNSGNCERAVQKGWKVIHYRSRDQFLEEIAQYCPAVIHD